MQLAAAKGSHVYYKVSTEELISDIKKVSLYLNKKSFSSKEYSKYGKYSTATCFKRFHTWNNALAAAELEPFIQVSNKRLCDEDLLKEIETIWIKLGRQPTAMDIKKGISKYSLHAYSEHFGGWRGSLKAFIKYINDDTLQNKNKSEDLEKDIERLKDRTCFNDIPTDVCNKHKTARDVNLRLRFKVMQRDNFKCCMCGATPATDSNVELHIDHIIPWSKGGETELDNLQTLCSKCNLGKSDLY